MLLFKTILAFVVGSFPTGYIMARILKKTDIRKEGSGNIGATNVWRVVGKLPGVAVLLIDILKGYFMVRVFSTETDKLLGLGTWEERILLGLAVILGHNFSIFLKFRGGKGVATSAGVIFALDSRLLFICLFIWIVVFLLFRYISLASLASSISLPIFLSLAGYPFSFILFGVSLALLISFKHLANIRRLLTGEEPKLKL
jgi:glycerol-3-phosphate acyltransferase PlsY